MPSVFERLKHCDARQGLILGNPTSYSQATVDVQHRCAPELAALIRFRITFFRPCCARKPTRHPTGHAQF